MASKVLDPAATRTQRSLHHKILGLAGFQNDSHGDVICARVIEREQPRRLDFGRHFDERQLNRLERTNQLAELSAFARVGQYCVWRRSPPA